MALDVAFAAGLLHALEACAKVVDEDEVGIAVLPVALGEDVDAGGEEGEVVEGHGRRVRGGGEAVRGVRR